jgi:hypothetical protein
MEIKYDKTLLLEIVTTYNHYINNRLAVIEGKLHKLDKTDQDQFSNDLIRSISGNCREISEVLTKLAAAVENGDFVKDHYFGKLHIINLDEA